jgi:hypothetical protein
MDNDSKKKLRDVLSEIDPVEFRWEEEATSVGFTAQTIDDTLYITDSADTITLGNSDISTIDMSSISGNITIGANNSYNWANSGQSFTISNGVAGTQYNSDEIKLPNGKSIDLDELHDMLVTLKKRLLILTPSFEMHEKYPMLKQMYDEYVAMEKLLSGPDTEEK